MVSTPTVNDRYSAEEIASYYNDGFWESGSLYDLVEKQAAARAGQTFVFDSTTTVTFEELREQSLRLAAGLHDRGIGKGDRVAAQLPNWTEFVLLSVALSRLGAIIVPIMPIYRGEEVRYVLENSGAKAVVTCEEFKKFRYLDMFAELKPGLPNLELLIAARPSGDLGDDVVGLPELFLEGSLADLTDSIGADSSPDDGFLIVYTSGTTSRPKGCFHTVNTIRASSAAIIKGLDYTDKDVQFGPSPITHTTGLVTSVILPLIAGAKSHLMEAWDPVDGLRRIEEYGVTCTVTATAFLQMLLAAYDPAKHDASSMRYWVAAGAPIPQSVVETANETLNGGRVLSLYGRSENALTTMCTSADDPSRSATSDGTAIEGAAVKIIGVNGEEVPIGQEGDISYKGPSHMIGYWGDPQQTAELFTRDGFSRSGDLGVMDADGFVRVTGRLKDIVIRGGLNISAREIEELLMGHPAVANAAIVGMPDDRLGEKVCAYVILAEGQDEPSLADLTDYLRERKVATPKLPEHIEVVTDFPMTATGKIQKHILRAEIARKIS